MTMRSNLVTLSLLITATGTLTTTAWAGELRCNRDQTVCTTQNNRRLTVGDRIGIFNADEELVGYGAVSQIENDGERQIKLEKTNGKILASHRLELLDDQSGDLSSYKFYRDQERLSAGADLSLASLGVGEGAPAIMAEGFAQWRWRHGVHLVGRGIFLTGQGEAQSLSDGELNNEQYQLTGFGALPAAAYYLMPRKPISLRFEGGIGFMYVNASVSGGRDVAQYLDSVEPGFGLLMRAGGSALLNYGIWHPELSGTVTRVQDAMAYAIGLGVIRELP